MTLTYHRSVQTDVSAVLAYYDELGGPALGDAFFDEFMVYIALVLENPTRFHPVDGDLRRANLSRFPYHFLYRIHNSSVRILVVRHHQRNPLYWNRSSVMKHKPKKFRRKPQMDADAHRSGGSKAGTWPRDPCLCFGEGFSRLTSKANAFSHPCLFVSICGSIA